MMAHVLGEIAVAGERHEILDQRGDIVEAMRPVGMARDLRLLPGRQLARRSPARAVFAFCSSSLTSSPMETELSVALQRFQILDLAFQLGDRLFEIEIGAYHHRARATGRQIELAIAASPGKRAAITAKWQS